MSSQYGREGEGGGGVAEVEAQGGRQRAPEQLRLLGALRAEFDLRPKPFGTLGERVGRMGGGKGGGGVGLATGCPRRAAPARVQ